MKVSSQISDMSLIIFSAESKKVWQNWLNDYNAGKSGCLTQLTDYSRIIDLNGFEKYV